MADDPSDTGRHPSDARSASQSRRGAGRLRAVRSRELADRLRQEILAGTFASGSLPDEQSLTTMYGSTRNAIRDALRLLAAEGLLVRRPGLGTRIAARKFAHSLDRLAGLAESLAQQGTVVNDVRAVRWEQASPSTSQRLDIQEGTTVLFLQRLRLLDGEPLSLDLSYITADIGAALLGEDLRSRDVFAMIEEIAMTPLGTAVLRVQAINADSDVADALGLEVGDAVFAVERLTRLSDGRPVDVENLYFRGDRVSFISVLHRSPGPAAPNATVSG